MDPEFRRFKEPDTGSGSLLDLCMEPEQRFLGKKKLKKKRVELELTRGSRFWARLPTTRPQAALIFKNQN
jgi:hypothetical protein